MPSINICHIGSGEVFQGVEADTVGDLRNAVHDLTGMPVDMQCYRSKIHKKGLLNSLKVKAGVKKHALARLDDSTPLHQVGVSDGDDVAVAGDMDGGVICLVSLLYWLPLLSLLSVAHFSPSRAPPLGCLRKRT